MKGKEINSFSLLKHPNLPSTVPIFGMAAWGGKDRVGVAPGRGQLLSIKVCIRTQGMNL